MGGANPCPRRRGDSVSPFLPRCLGRLVLQHPRRSSAFREGPRGHKERQVEERPPTDDVHDLRSAERRPPRQPEIALHAYEDDEGDSQIRPLREDRSPQNRIRHAATLPSCTCAIAAARPPIPAGMTRRYQAAVDRQRTIFRSRSRDDGPEGHLRGPRHPHTSSQASHRLVSISKAPGS